MNPLQGLTKSINTTESAIRDLSVLESMDKRMQQIKQGELQAQAVEQTLMERMYATSDQMLEKDRVKINKRFAMAQKQIREAIKASGGSRRRFMEDGGLALMNNVANEIIRSPESIRYQENKTNLARILEAQTKGFGHLITPGDMKSVENYYNNEEGGQITFRGLMNEIKLPPTEAFDYGHVMTPEEVLNYDSNRFKITANYKLANPGKPEPTKEELEEFMRQMNYGGYGTNTTRMREEMYQKRLRNQAEAKKKDSGESFLNNYTKMNAWVPKTLNAKEMDEKYGGGYYTAMKNGGMNAEDGGAAARMLGEKNKIISKKRNINEAGFDWNDISSDTIRRGWENVFNDNYGLKDSYEFMELSKWDIAQRVFGGEENGFKVEGGKVIGYLPHEGDFRADGTMFNKDNKPNTDYRGNYEILGVFTAHKAGTADGKADDSQVLLMDIYDNDGKLDKERTMENNQESYYGDMGGSQIKPTTVIALRDDNDDVVYKEIDLTRIDIQRAVQNQVGEDDDISDVVAQQTDSYIRMAKMRQMQDQERIVMQDNINTLNRAAFEEPSFTVEGEQFYGDTNGELNRNDMMKAYYTAISAMTNPNQEAYPSQVRQAINQSFFTQSAFEGSIEDDLKDYDKNPEEIINKWLQNVNDDEKLRPDDIQFNQALAQKWMQVLSLME